VAAEQISDPDSGEVLKILGRVCRCELVKQGFHRGLRGLALVRIGGSPRMVLEDTDGGHPQQCTCGGLVRCETEIRIKVRQKIGPAVFDQIGGGVCPDQRFQFRRCRFPRGFKDHLAQFGQSFVAPSRLIECEDGRRRDEGLVRGYFRMILPETVGEFHDSLRSFVPAFLIQQKNQSRDRTSGGFAIAAFPGNLKRLEERGLRGVRHAQRALDIAAHEPRHLDDAAIREGIRHLLQVSERGGRFP
jgi:hypothetical protein